MNQPTALFSDTFDLPLADIHADPARFQGRLGEFSEDTVNAIVGKGHYDRSKSPITVWRDPANGKFYILSGHSRFEAAKRIYASGKQPELASLPVKQMMVDDVTAAIEYAVLESNRKSTEEGLVPDIMAYRKAVQLGKNAAYLKSIFRPDSRFQKLKELSTLNPKGMFIEQLAAPSQHSFPYLERNARWVGNMRAQFPALTDLHERELFDYLYGSKKGLNITKQQFFDLVNSKVSRIDFDPANALNLANRISPTAYTDPINEQLREIDKDIATTEREIENLRTNLARAKSEGIAPPLVASTNQVGRITMEARISELNNHIVTKYQAKAKLQQDAGRLERTMGGDLFSMMDAPAPAPAPAPEQAAELPMDDAPELLQWYPMDDWETNLLRARKTYLSNFDDKTRAAHRKALGSEWVNIWSDLPRLVAHINAWRAGRPDAPPPQPRMINPTFSDESTMKDKIIAKVNAETEMQPESNEIEYTVTVKDFEMPSRQEYKPTKQSDRREHPMIQVGNLVDRMFKGIGPIWPMMRRGSEWLYDTQGMKPKRVVINVFWVNNHTVRVNWIVQQKTYGRPFKYMANGQVSTGTKAIYRHSYDDDGITVNVGEPLQVNTGDTILYGYSQDTSGTGKVTEVYFDPLGRAYDVRVKRKAGDYINVNVQDITLVVAEQPKKANEKIISLEPMNKIVQRSPIQAINGLALFTSSAGKFVVMGKEIQKVSTNYNKDFIMDGAKPNAVFWLAQNIKMYPQERMFTNPADAQRVPLNKIYSTKENKESSFIVAAAKMMEAAHGNGEPRGPITVEKMPDGRYHVKDGNATFEVAKRSGWDYIPAIVVNEQPTQITDPKRKRMLMMAKAAAARARALELK